MPDLRISQLPSYLNILSATGDAFLIIDSTNNASKKISPSDLIKTFLFSGTTDPVGIPAYSPAIYQQTTSDVTWIYDGGAWRQISGGTPPQAFNPVPYLRFTSSNVGSTNQNFVSSSFVAYDNNTDWMSVYVNGVFMTPVDNYSVSGAMLTILDFLAPSALIEVSFKVVPVMTSELGTQDGNIIATEQGDELILN